MEGDNSTKEMEEILIVNALLHDIGKYFHRLGVYDYQSEVNKRMSEELRYAHPEWGYNFITREMKDICGIKNNLELLPLLTHHLDIRDIEKKKNTIKTFLGIKEINDEEWNQMLKLQEIVRTADYYSASERDEEEKQADEKVGGNKRRDYENVEILNPFSYVKGDFNKTFVCLKLDGEKTVYPREKNTHEVGWEKNEVIEDFKKDILMLSKIKDFKSRINSLNSILQKYLQFIPSSIYRSDSKENKVSYPTVSLYEHLKTTAAIALSLYRSNNGRIGFILGDLSGIQKFIFNKYKQLENPAKIFRGRSSFINLLTLITIERIKEKFDLYDFNVITNNGGNFLVITNPIDERQVEEIEKEINLFLIKNYGLTLTYSLTYKEFDIQDVFDVKGESIDEEKFSRVIKEIHILNAIRKNRKFKNYLSEVIKSMTKKGDNGLKNKDNNQDKNEEIRVINENDVCEICGLHKKMQSEGGLSDRCELCDEMVKLGDAIRKKRLIYDKKTGKVLFKYGREGKEEELTHLFNGVWGDKEENNKRKGKIIIKINNTMIEDDIIDEDSEVKFLFAGNYVPYKEVESKEGEEGKRSKIMTFEEIASKNNILVLFKSDIDNLGDLFERKWTVPGNNKISFSGTISRYSFISFLINFFYSVNLNKICGGSVTDKNKQKKIYTPYIVFSGGDDLTAVINSEGAIEFIIELSKKFDEFFQNDEIHFSAGVTLFHHKKPVDKTIEITENLLKEAKSYQGKDNEYNTKNIKNAIAFEEDIIIKRSDIVDTPKIWNLIRYGEIEKGKEGVEEKDSENQIVSKSTLYFLLMLWNQLKEQEDQFDNRKKIPSGEIIINENALIYYNLKRNMRVKDKEKKDKMIKRIISEFKDGDKVSNKFKIALEFYLLKERKKGGE